MRFIDKMHNILRIEKVRSKTRASSLENTTHSRVKIKEHEPHSLETRTAISELPLSYRPLLQTRQSLQDQPHDPKYPDYAIQGVLAALGRYFDAWRKVYQRPIPTG